MTGDIDAVIGVTSLPDLHSPGAPRSGHLPPDAASQERLGIVLDRMQALVDDVPRPKR